MAVAVVEQDPVPCAAPNWTTDPKTTVMIPAAGSNRLTRIVQLLRDDSSLPSHARDHPTVRRNDDRETTLPGPRSVRLCLRRSGSASGGAPPRGASNT